MARIIGNQVVIDAPEGDDVLVTGCVLEALQATGETSLSGVGNQRYDVPRK